MNDMIKGIKKELGPDWTNRRKVIQGVLIVAGLFLLGLLATAVWLAFSAKFGFYVTCFFVTFLICDFITILGVTGSYVFSARWENSDFLNILPKIIPSLNKIEISKDTDDVDNDSTGN